MENGIRWCPHCGQPHALKDIVCRATGKSLDREVHRALDVGHALIGKVIDGKYRVVKLIGSGGAGAVLEAENVLLRRMVALKVVIDKSRENAFERLRREAQIIASLCHPNICDVYDYGILPDEGPYLVTERLFGETLAVYGRRNPRAPVAASVDILRQILSALHAAHGIKVVHRDVKPANVYLVDRLGCAPLVKILDFGLAKDLTGAAGATITRPGRAVGTPQYMSPEQLRGEQVGPSSDLFSLGVIAYEVLTGVHPFQASSIAELHVKILREPHAPVRSVRRDLMPALDQFFDIALAKHPAHRFPDAIAMQSALVRLTGS